MKTIDYFKKIDIFGFYSFTVLFARHICRLHFPSKTLHQPAVVGNYLPGTTLETICVFIPTDLTARTRTDWPTFDRRDFNVQRKSTSTYYIILLYFSYLCVIYLFIFPLSALFDQKIADKCRKERTGIVFFFFLCNV